MSIASALPIGGGIGGALAGEVASRLASRSSRRRRPAATPVGVVTPVSQFPQFAGPASAAAFTPSPRQSLFRRASFTPGGVSPSPQPVQARLAMAKVPSAVGGMVRAVGGRILSTTGKLIGVTVNGRRFNRKQMVAVARRLGLETAAVALGLSVVELASVIADDAAKPRRRRGITARDITTTRRTIGKLKSMAKQAGFKCSPMGR